MEEREWVQQIVRGDAAARERFVVQFHESVYRWLRYLTGSGQEETAQELTQETFLAALRGLDRFEGRSALVTWLHRIAYHQFTHWLRDRRQQEHWHTGLEAAEELADPTGKNAWESLCLRQALKQLSEAHRDTFILHYVQQLSVQEVAEVLEVPPGTIQSRLYHARQKLRELLQEPAVFQAEHQEIGAAPAEIACRMERK